MRPSWDEHFLRIAQEVSLMGTCARRQVGCVLVDHRKRILATGFNGVPPLWPHCREDSSQDTVPCPGAFEKPGLTDNPVPGLLCVATHAEMNAVANCRDVWEISTAYCTVSPCLSCTKMLLSTGTIRIAYLEEYMGEESKNLWLSNNGVSWEVQRLRKTPFFREWVKVNLGD